jgi:dimethylamine monooxygenase subunit A
MTENSDISGAPPQLHFKPSPTLSMGLRSKRGTDWLGGSDPLGIVGLYARQMDEKHQLMTNQLGDIFALRPAGEAAALEAARLIIQMKGQMKDQSGQIDATTAFVSASRLIPEDILILVPNTSSKGRKEWRLQAGLLAFPGHWRLANKMGKNLAAIHAPVPEFQEKLSAHLDSFFANMQIGAISWRQNWSVQRDSRLFAPMREAALETSLSPQEAGQRIHIRIETQHFYKLPKSEAVIFAIRTSLAPLNFWQKRPEPIAALLEQIEKLGSDMLGYKAIEPLRPALQHWLESHIG